MKKPIGVILVAFCLIAIGALVYFKFFKDNFYGVLRERPVGDFILSAHTGRETAFSDFEGKAVVVFFGYTSCPDICPTTLSILAQVGEHLGKYKDEVQFIFISVDPKRDSLEKLGEYVKYFDEDFMGLTGSNDQLSLAAREFWVSWEVERVENASMEYLIGHTSSIFVVSPERDRYLKFSHLQSDPVLIAKDIKKLIRGF